MSETRLSTHIKQGTKKVVKTITDPETSDEEIAEILGRSLFTRVSSFSKTSGEIITEIDVPKSAFKPWIIEQYRETAAVYKEAIEDGRVDWIQYAQFFGRLLASERRFGDTPVVGMTLGFHNPFGGLIPGAIPLEDYPREPTRRMMIETYINISNILEYYYPLTYDIPSEGRISPDQFSSKEDISVEERRGTE